MKDGLAQLLRPLNPTCPPVRVPYRLINPYDEGSFLGYPSRRRWSAPLPSPEDPYCDMHEMAHDVPIPKLEEFLQSWLFFGLLHEFLGAAFQEAKYVAEDDEGKFVHTVNLESDLAGWSKSCVALPADEKRTRFLHLRKCLQLTADVLRKSTSQRSIDRGLRQSIAAVGSALSTACDQNLPQPGLYTPSFWPLMFGDSQVVKTMASHYWCRNEAVNALASFDSLSGLHFLENLAMPDLKRDHSKCDSPACRYLTIDDATYTTLHVDNCTCQDLLVTVESIGVCLDQDAIPLLSIRGNTMSDVHLEVVPAGKDTPYVALSHVWADGLGNKKATSLPRCQLLRLRGLVENLKGKIPWGENQPENRDLLFWCDSLCVPPEIPNNAENNRIRNLAMERMRKVYREADYVLVLDRTFELFSVSEIGMLEAAVRIFVSPWMHRLWTLQEAALPDRLVFQFTDRVVDLREIRALTKDLLRDGNPCQQDLIWQIAQCCIAIRYLFHGDELPGKSTLAWLVGLLEHRQVSYALDEPFCVTTLLNLDLTKLLNAPPSRRKEALWEQMGSVPGGIPKEIVFNNLPRLQTGGFKWAPATLLNNLTGNNIAVRDPDTNSERQATLTDRGLLGRFPAWRIELANEPIDFPIDLWVTLELTASVLTVKGQDDAWYYIGYDVKNTTEKPLYDANFWNVMSRLEHQSIVLLFETDFNTSGKFDGDFSRGLLAATPRNSHIKPAALETLQLVQVRKCMGEDQALWTRASELAQVIHNDEFLQMKGPVILAKDLKESDMGRRIIDLPETLAAAEYQNLGSSQDATAPKNFAQKKLEFMISVCARAMHAVIAEDFGPDTQWCVD